MKIKIKYPNFLNEKIIVCLCDILILFAYFNCLNFILSKVLKKKWIMINLYLNYLIKFNKKKLFIKKFNYKNKKIVIKYFDRVLVRIPPVSLAGF
jgi:hypothetical protein